MKIRYVFVVLLLFGIVSALNPSYSVLAEQNPPQPGEPDTVIIRVVPSAEGVQIDFPTTVTGAIENGNCDLPPTMEYSGSERNLAINELTTQILVRVDKTRLCWWVWYTWPGNGNGSQSSVYADSEIRQNGNVIYNPALYQNISVTNPVNPIQFYADSFEWPRLDDHGVVYELRVYAYQRQVVPGQSEDTWPGLAIDASAYPRNPYYKHYLVFVGVPKTTPPVCPVHCNDWSVRSSYPGQADRVRTLGFSTDGSVFAHLGWQNVSAPNCARFVYEYKGHPAQPPQTGFFAHLYRRNYNGFSLSMDLTSTMADGNVCINCSHLNYSLVEHLFKTGFFVQAPGCPRVYCQVDAHLKDPPYKGR